MMSNVGDVNYHHARGIFIDRSFTLEVCNNCGCKLEFFSPAGIRRRYILSYRAFKQPVCVPCFNKVEEEIFADTCGHNDDRLVIEDPVKGAEYSKWK